MEKINTVLSAGIARLRKMRLETLFLIIFLAFGVMFIAIVPPGWNTDETNHVYRIEQLAHGDLRSEKVVAPQSGLKAYGGLEPTNLVGLFDQTGAGKPGTVGNPDYKIPTNLYKTHPDITRLKDDGRRTVIDFSGAALYSPVAYAIYIPIFWLGKLLSLSFFWTIIISRLVGLILTGLAFFLAIKYMPMGKWIFFAVGLLPTIVAQAATVGADAPQLIASVLFITYSTRKLFEARKPELLDYGIFTILGAALLLVKFVYAPLLILLLAAPLIKNEYRNRKNVVLIGLTTIVAIIPGLIWMHLVSYIDINSNPQANFAAQKTFVLSHPLTYIRTMYYTFFTNAQAPLSNIFGSFVWGSVSLPAIYSYLASGAIFGSLFVRGKHEVSPSTLSKQSYRVWRITLLAVSLITGILIATALYVYSTTLHQSSIVGIQSQYFIPLLPIILLVLYGNTVKNQRAVKTGVVVLSCLALIGAVLAIHFRLYEAPAPLAT